MAELTLSEQNIARLFDRRGLKVDRFYYDPIDDRVGLCIGSQRFVLPENFTTMTVVEFDDGFVADCAAKIEGKP